MRTSTINESEYIFIHIRPNDDGMKGHPMGTIAVEKKAFKDAGDMMCHRVGFSICHSGKDSWNAKMGRLIAAGRASKSKRPLVMIALEHAYQRDLLLHAAVMVQDAAMVERVKLSRKFEKALKDTIERLQSADDSVFLSPEHVINSTV